MNDLRWTELAAHVVAWHNRNPLARHIGVQHVHSLGYVMMPFADAAAARGEWAARAIGPDATLPLPGDGSSLRERAMARARMLPDGAAAQPDDAPHLPPAPVDVRPAFDEDFFAPHALATVRRWAARHAVPQHTPRGDVQIRRVKPESGLPGSQVLPRWVLTAQVEVGRARTRVLVGPGSKPSILGKRLISPARTLCTFALAGVLAGLTSWMLDPPAKGPGLSVAASGSQASVPAPAYTSAPAAAPISVPASMPTSAQATTSGAVPMAASVVAPASMPAVARPRPSPSPAAASTPAISARAPEPEPAASAPLDVEPRLGRVELPSLGPRIDERRRATQLARQASAAGSAAATPARPAQAAPPMSVAAFAVSTRLLRTRSESEQVAQAMRALLGRPEGPPLRVEVLAAGDDWRVVGWPYTDRAAAERARDLLSARGMRVEVIDF